jgi:hypothetical protein
MGRQAKQNGVLILQPGMDPDEVDGKLLATAPLPQLLSNVLP